VRAAPSGSARAVGGLSLLNAIAGANSENLPVICVRPRLSAVQLRSLPYTLPYPIATAIPSPFDRTQRVLARAQITGGVNSNDMGTNHIIHHTIGRSDGTSQDIEAFRPFVCDAVRSSRLCSATSGEANLCCDKPCTLHAQS